MKGLEGLEVMINRLVIYVFMYCVNLLSNNFGGKLCLIL